MGTARHRHDQPGLSGSLIRHRWLSAVGSTATVAAMAGGGLARVVLPGDGHYQVADAAGRWAGDSLVVTALPGQPVLGAGRSVLVAFTAEGSTAVPASVTFQDAASGQPARAGSTGGLSRSGWSSQDGWSGAWWLGPEQHGYGGWSGTGPGGRPGGWPGGR